MQLLSFENMGDKRDILFDKKGITKLIKNVFEDEFKKREQNLPIIIIGNLKLIMQEIESLKHGVNELKRSMKFTENNLKERVNNVEEIMLRVKKDKKEICGPGNVNNGLTDVRNKLPGLKGRSKRNNI